ncbi:MAG: L-lactate permease [Vulcanimicrobiaceae bacterium]
MFQQLLTPVAGALLPSFLVATLPIVTVLVILGVLRRPAWQASLAGLIVGLVVSIGVWRLPPSLAFAAITNGAVFAVWPIMWIVFNALLLYNVAVKAGRFDAFRSWVLDHLPDDRRVILVVIGFCFGALLEGIAGFGTPVAITSSLLILVGFAPLDALVLTLIFDTAPVAFGALGVPITVLAAVTHLPASTLGAMVGRQLPFFATLLPFYVIGVYGGLRSVKALWPVLLVAGGSFGFTQFVCANFISYQLTDVLSSIGSLVATLLFLQRWKPAFDPKFSVREGAIASGSRKANVWHAWMPWIVVSATVIAWTTLSIFKLGAQKIAWPGLDKAIAITLYHGQPYAAVWNFEPLGTGTAILVAVVVTAFLVKMPAADVLGCAVATFVQTRIAIVTVMLIISLAYLMNYSGLNYTLGLGVSSVGPAFVFLSPFLGWVAVMLSGSDTSGNALFGNLQVVAANQLNLNPVLIAATNSSGGVMGKMISPQNMTTGASVTALQGQEGKIFARTFPHSIVLTALLGILVALQQYVVPAMIAK